MESSQIPALRKGRDFDAMMFGQSPTGPETDPEAVWHSRSIAGNGRNFFQWRSPRADAVIDRGLRQMDRDKRMADWRELHRVIADEQPCFFVRASPTLLFVKNAVGNINAYRRGVVIEEYFKTAGK